MPFTTLSSGLTLQIPTPGTKNWAATLQAQCWQKISEHDHTGSGKGKQIGTTAIANLAVTAAKIANTTITDAQLASNSVVTAKIADANVTLAKLANIATDRLIGRDTAGSGVPEEISVTAGLAFTGAGSIGIDTSGVTTARIADGNVTAAKLDADAASRSTLLFDYATSVSDGSLSITESDVFRVAPKALKITQLSISIHKNGGSAVNVTGGTLTLTLYKNGVSTGERVILSTGESSDYITISTQTLAAGDKFSFAQTRSALTVTGGSANIDVQAWGHFTE